MVWKAGLWWSIPKIGVVFMVWKAGLWWSIPKIGGAIDANHGIDATNYDSLR